VSRDGTSVVDVKDADGPDEPQRHHFSYQDPLASLRAGAAAVFSCRSTDFIPTNKRSKAIDWL